jgi:Tfp pilus assembly protein PilN
LADALETLAPVLEALETIRTFFDFAVQMETALPRLRTEHEALSAEVPKLRQQKRELQAALDAQMELVMQRQRDGLLVDLPKSILAARRV